MKMKSESEVAQLCPTLSDPRDYSPPGSSVHGIFQARVLEWVPSPSLTPFRYDLNKIPYDYTVEITNRFKRLDLTECLRNYGRRFMIL